MSLSRSSSLPVCVTDTMENHLPPPCLSWQIKAVIKIQAFVRANKACGDYRMLGKCLLIAALQCDGKWGRGLCLFPCWPCVVGKQL